MMKLALAPDQDGYTVDWANSAVASKLDGGASRLRRDYIGAPAKIGCTWTCTQEEMDYLMTFWRVTKEGTTPFYMDLIMSSPALTTHVCRFRPNSFKVSGIKGKELFKVQAVVEAEPLPSDDAFDEGLVTSFESFGVEAGPAYELLAQIVNVDMPANIK